MKHTSLILLSTCLLTLNACDHYSDKLASMPSGEKVSYSDPNAIEPAAGVAAGIENDVPFTDEKTFADYLKEGYMVQARLEQGSYDYKNAKYCTEKAYSLSNGQLVAPSSLENLDISEKELDILTQARAELITAIKTKNIPQNRFNLADAQVNFDCWVDHATENKFNSPCQFGYMSAMESLIAPDFIETTYKISFNADSGQLSDADRESMRQIIDLYKNNASRVYQIQISAGDSELSEKQVAAVKSVLKYNGVPQHKISHDYQAGGENVEVVVQRSPVQSTREPLEARIYESEHSTTVTTAPSSFY